MATILVTGGCGFIGSHLVDALVAQKHKVTVLDDLSTGNRSNLNPNAQLIVGSVTDIETVNLAMQDIDVCFHLAAIASPQLCTQDWVGTHQVNLTGAINIFNAAHRIRKSPVAVIYASSAAVYGNIGREKINESFPKRPLSAYGADKLGCELHAAVAGNIYKVPTCGLRFFNVYGPRQDPNSPYSGVISIFANRIISREKIIIFGNGKQTRDFIYIEDVVCYLIKAINIASKTAPIFNLCTGKGTSINKLAKIMMEIAQEVVPIEYKPPREGDIFYSVGDCTLCNHYFGIQKNIDLKDGLRRLFLSLKT